MDNADCPICYESLEQNEFVTFAKCKHRFCKFCANKLLMKENALCPIDNKKCKKVILINKQTTIQTYQEANVLDIQREVEMIWSDSISKRIQVVKSIIKLLETAENKLLNWLSNTDEITDLAVNNLLNEFEIEKNKVNDLQFEFVMPKETRKFLLTLFSKNPDKTFSLFWMNVFNVYLIMRWIFPSPELRCLRNKNVCPKMYLESSISIIQSNIEDTKEFLIYLTKFVISFVNNNRESYKLIQTNLDESEGDKCLMCVKIVDSKLYGKFNSCNHKICSTCVDRFVITHGSCPFHNNGPCYLRICKEEQDVSFENIYEYFESKCEELSSNIIKDNLNLSTKIIYQILEIKDELPSLIENLYYLMILLNQKHPNKEAGNDLVDKIKKTMHNILNKNSIKSHTLAVYRRNIYMKSFFSIQTEISVVNSSKLEPQIFTDKLENRHCQSVNNFYYTASRYVEFVNDLYSLLDRFCYIDDFKDLTDIKINIKYVLNAYATLCHFVKRRELCSEVFHYRSYRAATELLNEMFMRKPNNLKYIEDLIKLKENAI